MQRRQFLAAASTAAVALALPKNAPAAAETPVSGRQLIDFRVYRFANAVTRDAYGTFLGKAGVPAFKRLGVENVGLFRLAAADNPKLKMAEDAAEVWVILPHESAESFLTFEAKLAADEEYQEAGKEILGAAKSEPAFVRCDSHLLLSFAAHPKLTPPADRSERSLYELRTYESHSEERAANKVAMFNDGEIPIFKNVGMPGVFFGAAVAGTNLPHLTYMVHHGAENPQKHWDAFRVDPDWKKMSPLPQYKDNTSKILNWFLRPLSGSQL
jgi:hypothetical protein